MHFSKRIISRIIFFENNIIKLIKFAGIKAERIVKI